MSVYPTRSFTLMLAKNLFIDIERSSPLEFFICGASVFSAILSSVFINLSLPKLIKYLTGSSETSKTVTNTIWVHEVTSVIMGILFIFYFGGLTLYATIGIGFTLTSIAYLLYLRLINDTPITRTRDVEIYTIPWVKIYRVIYSIGNALTHAVIFSSVRHVFKDTPRGRGVGYAIYGIISIIAGMISALVIAELNVFTSYFILFVSQISIVVFVTVSSMTGYLKSTKSQKIDHSVINTAQHSLKFLVKHKPLKWLGLVAAISLSWAARTTSMAAYSYVKITLQKADYSKFMRGYGSAQLVTTVWYAILMGCFVRRYSQFSNCILSLGVGIPGLIFAIISYGSFIFYTEETSLPISPSLLGFLAGASQIAIIFYQMSFISEFINSESKLLQDEELYGASSAIIGLSSIFGSLGTFSLSLVADKILTISNNSLTISSLGLTADKTIPDSTIQTKFNRKSFWIIVVPCIIGLISDLGYHLSNLRYFKLSQK